MPVFPFLGFMFPLQSPSSLSTKKDTLFPSRVGSTLFRVISIVPILIPLLRTREPESKGAGGFCI